MIVLAILIGCICKRDVVVRVYSCRGCIEQLIHAVLESHRIVYIPLEGGWVHVGCIPSLDAEGIISSDFQRYRGRILRNISVDLGPC